MVTETLAVRPEQARRGPGLGQITERLGRVPEPNETIDVDGARFALFGVDGTRIKTLQA